MSLRTRSGRSNSGLTVERTTDLLKRGWWILEVIPKDSRFSLGFRLVLPETPDAPMLLVHNRAAEQLLKKHAGRELKAVPKRSGDPSYYIRYHVWVDNPTA